MFSKEKGNIEENLTVFCFVATNKREHDLAIVITIDDINLFDAKLACYPETASVTPGKSWHATGGTCTAVRVLMVPLYQNNTAQHKR